LTQSKTTSSPTIPITRRTGKRLCSLPLRIVKEVALEVQEDQEDLVEDLAWIEDLLPSRTKVATTSS